MKNFTLLLLLITSVSLTGCKKDPDKKDTENIVGKWYMKSISEKSFTNGTLTHEDVNSNIDDNYYIEFKSNGAGVDSKGDKFAYKVSDSKLTIRYEGDDEDSVENIKKLTSSELIVYGEESNTYEKDVYKFVYEYTYIKK